MEPLVEWKADATPLALSFVVVGNVDVPGPLLGGVRTADEGTSFVVETASGWMRGPVDGSGPARAAAPPTPPPGPSGWVAWHDDHRYRTDPDGWLVAERRCRACRRGWRRLWRLRVIGHTPSAPLVDDRRIVFAAMDNQVYGVRRKNGHRLWVSDIGERVSRDLVAAPVVDPDRAGVTAQVILVVPDDGRRLVALDALNGTTVASHTVENPDDRWVGIPAVTEDGSILLARQGYDPRSASVRVLRLVPPAPPVPPAPAAADDATGRIDYNDGSVRAAPSAPSP